MLHIAKSLVVVTHAALSSLFPPKRPPPRTPKNAWSNPRVNGLDVVLDTNEDPSNNEVVKRRIMIPIVYKSRE